MEHFVIIVNGFQPLTIITKRSILDVAAALAPPLYDCVLKRDFCNIINEKYISDEKYENAFNNFKTFSCKMKDNFLLVHPETDCYLYIAVLNKTRKLHCNIVRYIKRGS